MLFSDNSHPKTTLIHAHRNIVIFSSVSQLNLRLILAIIRLLQCYPSPSLARNCHIQISYKHQEQTHCWFLISARIWPWLNNAVCIFFWYLPISFFCEKGDHNFLFGTSWIFLWFLISMYVYWIKDIVSAACLLWYPRLIKALIYYNNVLDNVKGGEGDTEGGAVYLTRTSIPV